MIDMAQITLENYKKSQKIKETLIANTNFFNCIKHLVDIYDGYFTTDDLSQKKDFLYYVSLFYQGINDYAMDNYIAETSKGDYKYYLVSYNDELYKISRRIKGQEEFTFSLTLVKDKGNVIDINSLITKKEHPTKLIKEANATVMHNMIKCLSENGFRFEEIEELTEDIIDEILADEAEEEIEPISPRKDLEENKLQKKYIEIVKALYALGIPTRNIRNISEDTIEELKEKGTKVAL